VSLLEVLEVTKRFSGIRALDSVSLTVDEGEFVGLIGPNGAGKTTLFNCITGVLRPDAGSVSYRGRDVTRMPIHRRARLGMGRTFQRMELFSGMSVRDHLIVAGRARRRHATVLSDLTLRGRPSKDEIARADAILSTLDLAAAADRPIESLSLGHGRLVELGRALMTEPSLLFLDEPSSGLDRHETDEVAEVLLQVQRQHGTAILLVEHDIALVQQVTTRLHVLDYGTLIASGPTPEVLTDPRVREAYLGVGV
jgi:branched-chain amino acid transport system ATP-binding protein